MIRLIEVTQDDIENGVQGDCDKCAIALALRREYKTDKVNVGTDYYSLPCLSVNNKELNMDYKMERIVDNFMELFDEPFVDDKNLYMETVKPFTLEVVEWYKVK